MDNSERDMMATATSAAMTEMSEAIGMAQTVTGSAVMASGTEMSHDGGSMNMGSSCKITVKTDLPVRCQGPN